MRFLCIVASSFLLCLEEVYPRLGLFGSEDKVPWEVKESFIYFTSLLVFLLSNILTVPERKR